MVRVQYIFVSHMIISVCAISVNYTLGVKLMNNDVT